MTDNIINYRMLQGKTFTRVTNSKTNPAGSPFDLTNWTFRGQMKQSYSGSLVENFNMALSGSAVQGSLVIQLTAAQSAAITAGRYVYDIEIISGSAVKEWQRGRIDVLPEVTTS